MRVLQAFERVAKEFEPVEEGDVEKGAKTASSGLKSRLLKEVVESLPSLRDEVERYLRAIDRGKAREGKKEEMFKELTEEMQVSSFSSVRSSSVQEKELTSLHREQDCRDCLDAVHYELSELLADARKVLKKPDIDFIKVGEEEYLLEVRIAESKKIVPTNWVRINSTKAVYRFRPPAVQSKIEELAQRRERMAAGALGVQLAFSTRLADSAPPLLQRPTSPTRTSSSSSPPPTNPSASSSPTSPPPTSSSPLASPPSRPATVALPSSRTQEGSKLLMEDIPSSRLSARSRSSPTRSSSAREGRSR